MGTRAISAVCGREGVLPPRAPESSVRQAYRALSELDHVIAQHPDSRHWGRLAGLLLGAPLVVSAALGVGLSIDPSFERAGTWMTVAAVVLACAAAFVYALIRVARAFRTAGSGPASQHGQSPRQADKRVPS